jgi:hypothetical protein
MKTVALAAVAMIALTSVAEAQHRRDHRHGYHVPQHRHHVAPRQHRHNWVPYAVGGLALGALGAGAYYYNTRPTTCWEEPVYEYDRYGRRHIVAFERYCQ